MAIVRAHTAKGGVTGSTTSLPTSTTMAVTTGNTIVVFVRCVSGKTCSGVTDTAGNTYTQAAAITTGDPVMYVFYAKNITGHATNTVTAAFPVASTFAWIYALEYSGLDTSAPLDASGTNARAVATTATDCVTSAFSTATSGELVLVGASGNSLTDFTAGTDFTLVDGAIGQTTSHFGGVEEYITSTQLSSYTAHITSSPSTPYAISWISLKTPGAASDTAQPGGNHSAAYNLLISGSN